MDETKGTTQDSPQPGAGPTSGGAVGTTPPAKVFTEAEHLKAISDLKAEQGRKEKQLAKSLRETQAAMEAVEKNFQATSTRLEVVENQITQREMEGVRDNPNLLTLYQEKQSLSSRLREHEKKERDLAVREARVASIEAEAQETKKDALLSLLADKVTVDKLEKLKAQSMEALEAIVDIIGRTSPALPAPGAPEFKPDSGISSAGGGEITPEWAEKATPEEYAERRKKQDPSKWKP